MSTYADRLASFSAWPHASPTPQDLARAGLSHRPTREHLDNTICNICLHDMFNWQPDEDPAIELRILHPKCSRLWNNDHGSPISLEKPLPKDIGFFDPSLEYDFPELCLFQNVYIFCDRIKRCRHMASDILDVLPRCLRGEALKWFNQSKRRNLAVCLRDLKSRFPQQALPEEAPQASSQAAPQACQTPDYHHCKLCNASFSSMARLIRHTQENICNKPSCRHCEKVFSSKNQLHQHLREECRKQTHRSSSKSSSKSLSRSSSRSSSTWPSQSSTACSSTCSPIPSPAPSPASSPHPRYQAISPSLPSYLTVADLSARFAKPPYL